MRIGSPILIFATPLTLLSDSSLRSLTKRAEGERDEKTKSNFCFYWFRAIEYLLSASGVNLHRLDFQFGFFSFSNKKSDD